MEWKKYLKKFFLIFERICLKIGRTKAFKIFVVFMIIQGPLTIYQTLRYDINDYCCVQMSRDCERFFESMGIEVYQVTGYRYANTSAREAGKVQDAHRWIMLDFGFVTINFESTAYMFVNPIYLGFVPQRISDGFMIDGIYNETLEWRDFY